MSRYTWPIVVVAALVSSSCSRNASEYVARGDRFFDQQKYPDAEINYRKAILIDPKSGQAYYGLAKSLVKEGRAGQTYEPLLTAARLLPDNQEIQGVAAETLSGTYLADPRRSKSLHDRLLQIAAAQFSKDPGSYIGLRINGILALDEKRPKDAIQAFQQASKAQPEHPDALLGLSQAFFEDGQFEKGEETARELIARDKTFLPIYDVIYVQYAAANRMMDAESVLRLKVQNNPKDAQAVLQLASHYQRVQDRPKMQSTLQILLEHPADFPLAEQQAGDFYFAAGDAGASIHAYQAGASSHPGQKSLYQLRIAKVLAFTGKREPALQLLNEILGVNHEDVESRLLRANLWAEDPSAARVDQAVEELRGLAKDNPKNLDLRMALGSALLRKRDLNGAALEFSEVIRVRPDFVAAHLALARIAWSQGKYDVLLRHAEAILRVDPRNTSAELMEAAGRIGTGEYEAARKELESLQAAFPKDINVQLQLGLLAFAQKKYSEAEKIFRGIQATDTRRSMGLAEVYFAETQTQKALDILKAEVARSPGSREARAALAAAAGQLGDYDLAIAQYQAILSLDPGSEQAQIGLGENYRRKGDTNSAIRALKQAVDQHPRSAASTVMLAYTYEVSGQLEDAKALYRRSLEVNPDPAVMNNLANLLAESNDHLDEALTLVQNAMKKMHDQPVLWDTLGMVYLKKGMKDSALRTFANVVKQRPDNSLFRYHLGMSLAQNGDKRQARVEFTKALKSDPDSEISEKIKRALVAIE